MKIHFIGISGIGVSALAKYYLQKGEQVTGSDLNRSEVASNLEKLGAKIFYGQQKADNVASDIDLVVYTVAVPKDNPELLQAGKLKIKTQTYPEALGDLVKKHFTIAVCGMSGKSTTTSMTGIVLKKAGLSPNVIVGTRVKEFENSNCLVGKSNYLVIEACEYEASFLNYWPRILAILNIEEEHLDYYRDIRHIMDTFKEEASHLKKGDVLIFNKDDENTAKLIKENKKILKGVKLVPFSLKDKEAEGIKKILKVPGKHNISNALSALKIGRELKISDEKIYKALSQFKGTWRRFEIIKKEPFILISDYAHHPTKLKALLEGAREKYPKKTIWAVFQSHQYDRTKKLFDKFIPAFEKADKIILTEIYYVAGREKKLNISSKDLVEAIKKKSPEKEVLFMEKKEDVPAFIRKNAKKGDVVLVIGAGDIINILKFF